MLQADVQNGLNAPVVTGLDAPYIIEGGGMPQAQLNLMTGIEQCDPGVSIWLRRWRLKRPLRASLVRRRKRLPSCHLSDAVYMAAKAATEGHSTQASSLRNELLKLSYTGACGRLTPMVHR